MAGDRRDCDLFLLAHPDDDIFVRPLIRTAAGTSRRVVVMYLTQAEAGGRCPIHRRRDEALRALRSAGVASDDVHFVGIDRGFPDGRLFENLDECLAVVQERLPSTDRVGRVISHTWEGGHPDHDAAHLVARALAAMLGCLDASLAFPAYRSAESGLLPFTVCAPLDLNGPRCDHRLRLSEAVETLSALRHYRSQWLTFLGLGPALAWQLLARRAIPLQHLGMSCAPRRPTGGPLLSETRFRAAFSDCSRAATDFITTYGIGPSYHTSG